MKTGRYDLLVAGAIVALTVAAAVVISRIDKRAETPDVKIVSWLGVSDRKPDQMGRAAFRARRWGWRHGESSNFICHGPSSDSVIEALRSAEFAYRISGAMLAAEPLHKKGRIFVFSSERAWRRVARKSGFRADSLGVQVGREILVFAPHGSFDVVTRVPHEVVHLRLWQTFGGELPVWMDEGLAAYFGWKTSRSWGDGTSLVRNVPPVPPEDIISFDSLMNMTEYPAEAAASAAFSRQVEELIAAIARKIGDDRLGEFARAMADGRMSWKEYLRERFAYDDEELLRLEKRASERAVAGGEFRSEG